MNSYTLIKFLIFKDSNIKTVFLLKGNDCYSAYGDDAVRISQICEEVELRKTSIHGIAVQFIEFPHYEIDTILTRLIRAGEKVRITD